MFWEWIASPARSDHWARQAPAQEIWNLAESELEKVVAGNDADPPIIVSGGSPKAGGISQHD